MKFRILPNNQTLVHDLQPGKIKSSTWSIMLGLIIKQFLHFALIQNEAKNQGKTNTNPHLAIPRTANEVVECYSKTQAPSMHF